MSRQSGEGSLQSLFYLCLPASYTDLRKTVQQRARVGKKSLPERKSARKELGMYAAIRRLRVQPGVFDEVVQRDESGLVPLLRSAPGFVEFDLVQVGEDVGVSITIFET